MAGRSNDGDDVFIDDEVVEENDGELFDSDDEEEEIEEGQDEYEKDGFIVDDVDEEEEEVNVDSDGERQKKKKKKKKRESEKSYVLDEDDYELLKDNNVTGFRRPNLGSNKFKRLKKRTFSDEQGSELFDHDTSATSGKGGQTAEERLKRSLFGDDGDLEDSAEEEQQREEDDIDIGGDEMDDFIVDAETDKRGSPRRSSRRNVINKKSRQASAVSSAAIQEAYEMFGDADELLELREQGKARMSQFDEFGGLSESLLEDKFEPIILSEKYMTKKDEQIRAIDVPERIQLSEEITGPPPTNSESIIEEGNWILKQLVTRAVPSLCKICPETVEEGSELSIDKGDIMRFLEFLHKQKLDVPYIAMYKKDNCRSLFKNSERHEDNNENQVPTLKWYKVLWAILDLDKKWLLLQKRKTALQSYYNKRINEDTRNICEETRTSIIQQLKSIVNSLQAAESDREIDDVESKFNLHFPPDELVTGKGQYKRPKRKSQYNTCSKAGLGNVAAKFGYTSERFGLLISLSLEEMRRDPLVDGKETPEEVASKYTCPLFETPESVLKGARHMAAMEISCEPCVRRHVRSIFMDNAKVSTRPNADSRVAIDPNHQLATVKWLKDKPLTKFEDAQWLLILKAEEEKLIEVFVKLPESTSDKLISDCLEYYLSDCVSKIAKLWNKQREEILKDAFHNFLLPSMEKEARALLTARAKSWALMDYGKLLWDKVSVAPYGKKEDNTSSHDCENAPRVMACCWGPGNPPNTFVMLDSAGGVMDVLCVGFLCTRGKSPDDEQLKINDQQRLLKFMNDHRPHVVVLGAANLYCPRLKEGIYEMIFKRIEDNPREVGLEMDSIEIVYGDESLPRLYENSSASSDQLPKQSGGVKRAVALGRYLQNPLAMVATLCGPGKEILSWKLSPLESFLTPDEKYGMVEQVMIDVTNQVGLDVNLASSQEWLFAPLQFISGLGPRKAASLQRSLVRGGAIVTRKEFFDHLGKKVFVNAVGFLRVCRTGKAANSSHEIDLLEDTRIHPENYKDAEEFCKKVYSAALEDDFIDDEDMLEMARENPVPLKALLIDQYASSNECENQKNMLSLLRMELIQGFQDWRRKYAQPNQDEEFYMISGETKDTLAEGKIVQVTVRKVQSDRAVCTLESGLTGILSKENYNDGRTYTDLTERLKVGDILTCKVESIQKNWYQVSLSCTESEPMSDYSHNQVLDVYYHENWSIQQKKVTTPKEKDLNWTKFKPRMIVHPHFKNVTMEAATKLLSDKDPGESIIHPSPRGPSYLNLTLKVYDGVYAHKEIVESGKTEKDVTSWLRLGKTLKIDEEIFEDLDEVKDRYIDPLVANLKAMLIYRKFREGTKAEVDDFLRSEKFKNPMRIVYSFGIWHEHPGLFILTYIRSINPHHEYIGVHPMGFKFRKKMFKDIDRLVAYFQQHIADPRDMPSSVRSIAAIVPMQSATMGGSNTGNGHPVDQYKTSTLGFSAVGGDHGKSGKQNWLPSAVPNTPGQGQGSCNSDRRNETVSDRNNSDNSMQQWGSRGGNDNGWSNFPGLRAQNSPGIAFPGGWVDGGGGYGSRSAGGWGGSGGGNNNMGCWNHGVGNSAATGRATGTPGGWGGVTGCGHPSGTWDGGRTDVGGSGGSIASSWAGGSGGWVGSVGSSGGWCATTGSGASSQSGGRGGGRRGAPRGGGHGGRSHGTWGGTSDTGGSCGGWYSGNANVRGCGNGASSGWGGNGGQGQGSGSGHNKEGGESGGWGCWGGKNGGGGNDDGNLGSKGEDVGSWVGGAHGGESGDGSWGSKGDGAWGDKGGGNDGRSKSDGGWGSKVGGNDGWDAGDGSRNESGWGNKGGENDGRGAGESGNSGGKASDGGWGKW